MAFHERWFQGVKQRRLAEVLLQVPDGPGALVEVGSWEGRSTILIALAFPGEPVHVIDHWKGDLRNPKSPVAELAAQRDVFFDFAQNTKQAGVYDRLVIHRDDWRNVFATWDQPIKMIFIDGEHTYREVYDNVQAALPFMVPGGVLCGDDYSTTYGIEQALRDCFGPDGVTIKSGPGRAIWSRVQA